MKYPHNMSGIQSHSSTLKRNGQLRVLQHPTTKKDKFFMPKRIMSIPTHSLFRCFPTLLWHFSFIHKYILFFCHILCFAGDTRLQCQFHWWKPEWEIIWFACTKFIMKGLWIILSLIMEYKSVCNCIGESGKKRQIFMLE